MRKYILAMSFLLLNQGFASLSPSSTLIGQGILYYSFFRIKVYNISYYKSDNKNEEFIKIKYLRNVKSKHLQKGWEIGFTNNNLDISTLKDEMAWLETVTPSVKKDDEILIKKSLDKIEVYFNNNLIGQREGKIAQIIYQPWIGPNPVDQDLKNKLLGI